MPWYSLIFLVLVGLACSGQLVDNRSIEGASIFSTGLPTAVNRGEETEQLNLAKNYNAALYRALISICDDVMIKRDKIMFHQFCRDFQTNSHERLENTLSNILSSPDRPTKTVISDIDGTLASTKLLDDEVPFAQFDDYFEELTNRVKHEEMEKRAGSAPIGCDCKLRNDLLDLGQQHFPRYLLNAVCQTESANDYPQKCRRGTHCKPLEYKVKVLTFRSVRDQTQKDPALVWLPDDLRQLWKFKTVTVAAGCFCSY